jgi:pimeloyl-ACP methyl ester carboxylesterase
VGERDGYCFAAFRGTTMTMADWGQNLQLGMKDVCKKGVLGAKQCCSTRSGFYEAYYTPDYHAELEVAIRKCAKTCADPNECVVFTGHSQGGAIAAVAGLELADLNPYVITFGQPRTIEYPCSMISSERWYRFVNSIADDGIAYDPIPMVPGMGADSFGHMVSV